MSYQFFSLAFGSALGAIVMLSLGEQCEKGRGLHIVEDSRRGFIKKLESSAH